ncbi:MAG: efflux RND transporter permease subunit, partial [Silvanigrellaceae bacterium]|nr:efflux RND transporter permease subunit [Silvanigrellaceae bacterium]
MFLSDLSVKRPVFATMMNVVLVVFGFFAIPNIGIDQDPNVDFPLAVVTAVYPGADPITVEQKLLKLMERNLNGLEGLELMEGSASSNAAMLILRFTLERSSSESLSDIRDRLAIIQGDPSYPKEARLPTVKKYDIAGSPAGILVLTANNKSLGALSVFARDTLSPILQQANGVGQVTLVGTRTSEIKIFLNPSALESFNLSPVFVANIVRAQIVEVPSGNIENFENLIQIQTSGAPVTLDDIKKISIPLAPGQSIALENVARVVDTLEAEQSYGELNGKSSIVIIVSKQTGENVVKTVHNLKQKIKEVESLLPSSVELKFIHDGSVYIKNSIATVIYDLILGALLAVLIVFLFLKDWRSTLISALALPIAIMGTIACINAFGFTLNSMSTLALTLSIGLLVDDAIVVIENIHRHLMMGKSPIQAAKEGTAEIGLATLAITLSIVAVFVPVAFMKGIVGRFFFQFGITVTVAVLLSLFIAFTLTPMLSSLLLKNGEHFTTSNSIFSRLADKIESFLNKLERSYIKILSLALRHRWKTLLIGVAAFMTSIFLLKFVPKSFVPNEDRSEVNIVYQLPSHFPLSLTKKKAQEMSEYITQHYSGIKDIILTVADDAMHTPYLANITVYLVEKKFRSYSFTDLQERMRKDFSDNFSGENIDITVGSPGVGGGRTQNIQLKLSGQDPAKLKQWADH